ncbi:MAG: ribosome biogenesis factor YjgA [Burkholderiales bacterium]
MPAAPLPMTDELPSKTLRKRQMHELQALGAELVELSDEQLASVELPERLRDAVLDARRVSKHEARRRQLQFIGKIMRTVDPEPIRERLTAWKAVSREQTARLHLLERWRTRLLEEENAITELLRDYPHADAPRLRTLVRNAQRERGSGQPPRSFRALFQVLDETLAAQAEERTDSSGE